MTEPRSRLIERASDRTFVAICAGLVTTWAVVALAVGRPNTSFNFNIYRDVAEWVNRTGALPPTDVVMPHGAAGSYADFSALNLGIYRVLFAGGPTADAALYVGWQALGYIVGIAVLILARQRIGLDGRQARWAALIVASPIVSGLTMVMFEDKALFFTLPVLALAASGRWARACTVGLVAGWLGAPVLTLALLLVTPTRRRRFDLPAALLGGVVALGATVAAGSASFDLLANRSQREALEPFSMSVWRLLADAYSPAVRIGALAAVAVLVLVAYRRGRLSFPAAYVALSALMLEVSTNTSWQRVVAVAMLGVLVWTTTQGRRRYLAAVTAWAVLTGAAAALEKAHLGSFAINPSGSWWVVAAPVVLMNAPLLALVGVAAWSVRPESARGAHTKGEDELGQRQAASEVTASTPRTARSPW